MLHTLSIIISVAFFFVLIWAAYDAFDHTSHGCAWLSLFILTGPVGLAIYLFMRLYANRPDQSVSQLADPMADNMSRFPTEIEKARFIEAASKGGGTMFNPEEGQSEIPGGFPHFSDTRAEAMITQRRFDEAWEYLIDLYSLAHRDRDGRAEDTYRHYINRLPGGAKLLQEWRTENEEFPEETKPPAKRDVPF